MVTNETNTLLVNATAGSGKTTTVVDGITRVMCSDATFNYMPSDEQLEIWGWMQEHMKDHTKVIVCAFSNVIADELKKRLKYGEASTIHSLGCRVLRENRVKYKCVKGWKTTNLLVKYYEVKTFRDFEPQTQLIVDDVKELVKFCKDRLLTEETINDEVLVGICQEREFETTNAISVLTPIVKYVLEEGSKLKESMGYMAKTTIDIDFDDMVYLPSRFNLSTTFDTMIIDEAQDLSPGKLNLVLNQKCNTYIFVGDPNQAIFGFAGADTQSFASIAEALPNHDVLPLSYTYRCGKAIVAEAQKIVGTAINAGKSNPDGSVININHDEMDLEVGDLLVSRVNAPLMNIAWGLVKDRKPVKVMGKNIGAGLVKLIKKLAGKNQDIKEFMNKAEAWRTNEVAKLQMLNYDTEERQIAINDQADCMMNLAIECKEVKEIVDFVKDIFDDVDTAEGCIRLSSIHRAKGLESNKVYFYNPSNVPHPMAKTDEAKRQEMNLKFVATTRAIHQLVYVKVKEKAAKKKKPVPVSA